MDNSHRCYPLVDSSRNTNRNANMNTPDRWVVVELADSTESVKKVFCGGYGGYGGSDTWKMSSQIEEIIRYDDRIEFRNNSGSVYRCYYTCYGMSGYMSSIFSHFESQQDKITIKVLDEYEPTNEQRGRTVSPV